MPIHFKAYDVKETRTNLPTPLQFRVGPNPSYVDSLISGVISPILHLPQILWFNSLWPFFKSLYAGVAFICLSVSMGVMGRANGFVTSEVVERELSEKEKQAALDDMLRGSGYKAVNLSAAKFPMTPEEDAILDTLLAGEKEQH